MILPIAAALLFWSDPGAVGSIDFSRPAGGVPGPVSPFVFIREEKSGTSAKVLIKDAAGVEWQVKGGPEGRAEAFVTRLVAAAGFHAEAVVFIREGRISNLQGKLGRAAGFIQPDGAFTWSAFERRDPKVRFLPNEGWKWTEQHNQEVRALKVMVMLVSNWDNKDARDVRDGSNTGVLETERGRVGFVTDWGQSMGGWGRWRFGRSNWNCRDYSVQTPGFVRGVSDGHVRFGYAGQHTSDFVDDIKVEDVGWLLRTLGHVTDAQIRMALLAAGASPAEELCFARALRDRIEALRRVTMNTHVHVDLSEVRRRGSALVQRVPTVFGGFR
jgi:hypothetical protein